LSGGVGNKDVVIRIDRIVPGYELIIYFGIVSSPELNNNFKRYTSDIIFKGGRGKPGRPIWTLISSFSTLFSILIIISSLIVIRSTSRIEIKIKQILRKRFTAQLKCLINFIYKIDRDKFPPEFIVLLDKIEEDDSIEIEEYWNELCNICKLINTEKN
jgi:hypothetical protein